MSDLNQFRSKVSSIRYSRYLGASTLVAMGSNITVGVGIFLLIGPILKTIGYQTPMAYILTLFFFIPIIFTLAERTPIIRDAGGMYDLTRARESVRRGFINGWMLLGGLIGLGALLAYGATEYLNFLLAQLFETTVSTILLTILLVLLLAVNQFLGTHAAWRKRRLVVFANIPFLLILLVLAVVKPQPSMMGYAYLPTLNEIEVIPYLAIGLWGIYFVLERSDQLSAVRSNILTSLLAPIVILAVLGAVTAFVLLRYPLLITSSDAPLLALAHAYHPLLQLILVGFVCVMMLMGLNQVFTSVFLLAGEMSEDGLLPSGLMEAGGERGVPERLLLLLTIMIVVTAVLFPIGAIATIASVCLLVVLGIIHSQDVMKKAPQLPEDRWLKLPLHPLFPVMVIIICLTLIFLQPPVDLLAPSLWLLVGMAFYLLYARQSTITKLQADVLVTEDEAIRTKTGSRIMVCISRPEAAVSLIRAGAAIANAEQGDLLVLTVLDAPEQTPDKQDLARGLLTVLEAEMENAEIEDARVTPLVRIAPSVSAGILSTAWEESVNTILLGWPAAHNVPTTVMQEGSIDYIVRRAAQEIIVLHGELPTAVHKVLAPMTSEAHEVTALKLGQALKQSDADTVMAIQPVRERLTEEVEAAFTERLQKHINQLDDTSGISGQVLQIANAKEALVTASEQYDLMILGMSDEGFLASTTFSGRPVEVAESTTTPTLLVKSAERQERFVVRRVWEELTNWLPAVDKRQQAAVYLGMRRDARATIDYYILILLATAIAYFGLLQNSSAVIIGAMLIAPLMSPILAMAQSIVQGNTTLLRKATNTTFNGILLAIGTAVVFTFGLTAFGFPIPATSEILARTQPNILDLMVALASGAAAAYAISRKEVASALPGVAIAAALVPPLAVVGYGIGSIQFDYASGALLLFITNLAAIILAGAITFLALGFRPPTRAERGEQTRYGLRMALVAMLIISIPLLLTTVVSNQQATTYAKIERIITNHWPPSQAQVANIQIARDRSEYVADFEVYDFSGTITTNDIIALQREVEEAVAETVTLKSVIINGQLDVVDGTTQLMLTPTMTPTITPTLIITPMVTRELSLPSPTATEYVPAITIEPTFNPTDTPDPLATETAVPATPEPQPTNTPDLPTPEPDTPTPTPETVTATPTEDPIATVTPTPEP